MFFNCPGPFAPVFCTVISFWNILTQVDPTKLASGSLLHHQSDLTMLCEMVCCKILNSPASFPAEIRAVFQEFRKQFGDRTNGNNLCNKLIR